MAASSESEHISDDESNEKNQIREDLRNMTFEEIMKLKEELGAKVYKEAVLGVDEQRKSKKKSELKRLNKNRPREMSAKRRAPLLGAETRAPKIRQNEVRDPRFDARAGEYNAKSFKNNYKFVTNIRRKEVKELKNKISEAKTPDERKEIKSTMQKLVNKNAEDSKWHARQELLKQEQNDVIKARAEGRQPHYVTKKERRVKELVMQFEELKKAGKLNKHLEKRRKKNAAKDRKKLKIN